MTSSAAAPADPEPDDHAPAAPAADPEPDDHAPAAPAAAPEPDDHAPDPVPTSPPSWGTDRGSCFGSPTPMTPPITARTCAPTTPVRRQTITRRVNCIFCNKYIKLRTRSVHYLRVHNAIVRTKRYNRIRRLFFQ